MSTVSEITIYGYQVGVLEYISQDKLTWEKHFFSRGVAEKYYVWIQKYEREEEGEESLRFQRIEFDAKSITHSCSCENCCASLACSQSTF